MKIKKLVIQTQDYSVKISNLLKEEELLNKQIEIINEKVLKDKKIINENQNKVFSLQKTNENLQNDKTINNLFCYLINMKCLNLNSYFL